MIGRGVAQLIRLYQLTLGRLVSGRCRFHPSCSNYAIQALRTNGVVIGSLQTIWRLLRCAPWSAGGIDYPARVFAGEGAGPLRRMIARSRTAVRHG